MNQIQKLFQIPDAKDIWPIFDWEKANTTYEKEGRFMGFLPIQKRIKPWDYFFH